MAGAASVPTSVGTDALRLPYAGGTPARRPERARQMPATTFALLIAFVIAAAGATLALAFWAGLPLVALGLAVLLASLWPGPRRWK